MARKERKDNSKLRDLMTEYGVKTMEDVHNFVKMLTAKTSGSDSVRAHYDVLAVHGSDCIECGSCESNCPFSVSVIENMNEAVRVFGK